MKKDLYFIVPTTVIFIASLGTTAADFVFLQKCVFHAGPTAIAGIALFVGGILLRLYCRAVLGKQYSYVLRTSSEQHLVRKGIYKYVRHPIYLAMIVYSTAMPMVLSSTWGFLVMLGLVPFVLYRIKIEEEMLSDRFGDVYRDYKSSTKKMIPFIF